MSTPRRKFLKSAAQLSSGLVLTTVGFKLAGCNSATTNSANNTTADSAKTTTSDTTGSTASNAATNTRPFGLQLYTLRDDLPKDVKGILKQVASFGYKQIEGYEGPLGLFWGMSNTDFKKYMDDLGMQFISSHCDTKKDFEKKAAQAAEIGMKYLIHPYLGPQKTLDDYKKAADFFNTRAEICRKAGIRFAYHNHDYSFKQLNGQFPQDIFMKNTDPSNMDYEMDIYWVVTAGQDPKVWLDKYPNRFTLGHVKDRRKNTTEEADSVVIGTGSINFNDILKEAEAKGMKYFIVEQERYDGTTPIKATQDDAEAMRRLQF